ncbi:MAG: hypothetical protein EOM50_13930 [Erysipelotrichia bacterium]|nr:hypothetical protein [Erysipelotrichia bacterium]
MKDNKNMPSADFEFYSGDEVLSYSRFISFCLGGRDMGKTHYFKQFLLNKWKKDKYVTAYFVRHKNEIADIHEDMFEDVLEKDSRVEWAKGKIRKKKNIFYIDDEPFMKILDLNSAAKLKRTTHENVKRIWFDEFLIEKNQGNYLPNEVGKFISLTSTIFRHKENTRIFMTANTTELINPYFSYFGILPNPDKKFSKYEDIVVEMAGSVIDRGLTKEKMTPLERVMDNSEYGAMAMRAEFDDNNDLLIEKLTRYHECMAIFTFENRDYGVWYNKVNMHYTISKKVDVTAQYHFSVTLDDLGQGAYKAWFETGLLEKMRKARNRELIFFDTIEVRENSKKMLQRLGLF